MSPAILGRVFQFLPLIFVTRSHTPLGDITTSLVSGDTFSQLPSSINSS